MFREVPHFMQRCFVMRRLVKGAFCGYSSMHADVVLNKRTLILSINKVSTDSFLSAAEPETTKFGRSWSRDLGLQEPQHWSLLSIISVLRSQMYLFSSPAPAPLFPNFGSSSGSGSSPILPLKKMETLLVQQHKNCTTKASSEIFLSSGRK